MINKIQTSRIGAVLSLTLLVGSINSSRAVNTISHAESLSSNGQITTSASTVPSAGGVTIGYFSGTAPTDSAIKGWNLASVVSNLISNNWVDVRSVGDALNGAGMQNGGDWDWPGGGSPGTAGTKIGGTYNFTFNAALSTKQLYLFAFNGGSSGFGYNASSVVAPSSSFFTASSFSGSTEYAILKADTWLFPATDNTAINIKVADIDLITELLVGTDAVNNVAMIPEPSSLSLIVFGAASLFLSRKRVYWGGPKRTESHE